ncbi:MAG TPA: hypothetical protein VFK69_06935 [Candidatus Eisenbacteria bacterium]|nr:hypothetical protein [Candidatus Eisenbacteria bacterium]
MNAPPELERGAAVTGRYAIFCDGRACGEERFEIHATPEGAVVTGEQVLEPPHPYPSRQEYRVTMTPDGRVTGLEIHWEVGGRLVHATHAAHGGRWHARIETGGVTREQEGDFPAAAEVEYPSHLATAFMLARYAFAEGGAHEFPVLRIGPPWMAVTPERMRLRGAEQGELLTRFGPVPARRWVVSLPPRGEDEGYSFWADEDGVVLESYEGHDVARPWMRLVEYRRARGHAIA